MSETSVFDADDVLLLVVAGAVALVSLALFLRTFRRSRVAALGSRLESEIGLPIPDALRPALERRLLRRQRTRHALTLVATVAATLFAFTAAVPDAYYRSFIVVASALAGSVIGIAIGSLHWPAPRDRDSIRVARAGAVGLGDYVAPLERWGARIFVGLAAAIYLVSVLMTATGVASVTLLPPATVSVAFVGLALIFLCFFEVVGRRIVRRAQPTGSELELLWDDAMRAVDVRALANTPMTLGFLGVAFSSDDLGIGLQDILNNAGILGFVTGAGWISLAGLVIVAFVSVAGSPERYFLRRLWPEYAATPSAELTVATVSSIESRPEESSR